MSVRLIDSLAATPELAEVFSDESIVRAILDFESALAGVQVELGVIPEGGFPEDLEVQDLAAKSLRAGTFVIPVVKKLTATSPYAHWGATSQDVSDTALVLLLRYVQVILKADHDRLQNALRSLSEKYADCPMLGRTLLQPAPPITFGLKVAGWYGGVERSWARVQASFEETLILQFGGASGTLAALGDRAMEVSSALAKRLNLRNPEAPWHSHRDRLTALVCNLGIYTGSLAKMARDISLLMQAEVGEAFEPGGDGRGGSSTMPHKRNPIACSIALAAANRMPGMVSSFLSGMIHEHERAAGNWHAEWPGIARIVQDAGLALASMREAAEGMIVDPLKMRANISATRGVIFAEQVQFLLAAKIGRHAAAKLVEKALQTMGGRTFAESLFDIPEVTAVLSIEEIRHLEAPDNYLGMAHEFRRQLLQCVPRSES